MKSGSLWWKVAVSKWQILVVVPLLNFILTILFWQSQIIQYDHSTKGILFMWLTAGLIFILLQLSLQINALRQALTELAPGEKRIEVLWSLIAQIILFVVIIVYNSIILSILLLHGILPNKPLDFIIFAILGVTGAVIAFRYRLNLRNPHAKLLLATGMKAAPQWIQAVNFVIFGSMGMNIVTISAIIGMGLMRYVSAKHTANNFHKLETTVAHKAAFRDVVSVMAMCVGWGIGRL